MPRKLFAVRPSDVSETNVKNSVKYFPVLYYLTSIDAILNSLSFGILLLGIILDPFPRFTNVLIKKITQIGSLARYKSYCD